MTRKSAEERITALDLDTSHYMIGLIHKGIPLPLALQSAEKTMKQKNVAATPGQTVLGAEP